MEGDILLNKYKSGMLKLIDSLNALEDNILKLGNTLGIKLAEYSKYKDTAEKYALEIARKTQSENFRVPLSKVTVEGVPMLLALKQLRDTIDKQLPPFSAEELFNRALKEANGDREKAQKIFNERYKEFVPKDLPETMVSYIVGHPGIGKTVSIGRLATKSGANFYATAATQFDVNKLAGMVVVSLNDLQERIKNTGPKALDEYRETILAENPEVANEIEKKYKEDSEEKALEYVIVYELLRLKNKRVIFFIDELNTAPDRLRDSLLKFFSEKSIGGVTFKKAYIITAGNPPPTGSEYPYTGAFKSRLAPVSVVYTHLEWLYELVYNALISLGIDKAESLGLFGETVKLIDENILSEEEKEALARGEIDRLSVAYRKLDPEAVEEFITKIFYESNLIKNNFIMPISVKDIKTLTYFVCEIIDERDFVRNFNSGSILTFNIHEGLLRQYIDWGLFINAYIKSVNRGVFTEFLQTEGESKRLVEQRTLAKVADPRNLTQFIIKLINQGITVEKVLLDLINKDEEEEDAQTFYLILRETIGEGHRLKIKSFSTQLAGFPVGVDLVIKLILSDKISFDSRLDDLEVLTLLTKEFDKLIEKVSDEEKDIIRAVFFDEEGGINASAFLTEVPIWIINRLKVLSASTPESISEETSEPTVSFQDVLSGLTNKQVSKVVDYLLKHYPEFMRSLGSSLVHKRVTRTLLDKDKEDLLKMFEEFREKGKEKDKTPPQSALPEITLVKDLVTTLKKSKTANEIRNVFEEFLSTQKNLSRQDLAVILAEFSDIVGDDSIKQYISYLLEENEELQKSELMGYVVVETQPSTKSEEEKREVEVETKETEEKETEGTSLEKTESFYKLRDLLKGI